MLPTAYLLYWVTAGWVREQLKMFLLQVIQVSVSKATGLPTCSFPSKIVQDIFKHLQEHSFAHAFPSFYLSPYVCLHAWRKACWGTDLDEVKQSLKIENYVLFQVNLVIIRQLFMLLDRHWYLYKKRNSGFLLLSNQLWLPGDASSSPSLPTISICIFALLLFTVMYLNLRSCRALIQHSQMATSHTLSLQTAFSSA